MATGLAASARAVPSFARQTGFDCTTCHTVFPELTPLGRRFKLGGFTWTSKEPETQVLESTSGKGSPGELDKIRLWLSQLPPVAAFMQASVTTWNRNPVDTDSQGNPHLAQNPAVLLPQQISLLYAGRVADVVGAWAQLTYDQSAGTIGIDNFDLRYADHSAGGDLLSQTHWGDLLWGVTINNQPTTEDVWNTGGSTAGGSTGFGIPNFPIENQIASPASPLLLTLAQQSAGLGAYVFIKDSLYAEAAGYVSSKPALLRLDSTSIAPSGTIDDVAPYWRVAYEKDWQQGVQSLMIGTTGMYTEFAQPAATGFRPAGSYLDLGLDAQYQYIGADHIFTASASLFHELSTNAGSLVGVAYTNQADYLDRVAVTARYLYKRTVGLLVNFSSISGGKDQLAYCGALAVCDGSPAAMWETFELDYLLRLNIRLLLEYNLFNRLDSASNAFAGTAQPGVSGNNSLVAGLWLAF